MPGFSSLDDRVDPKHTVLLVIDVQNDFIASDGARARLGNDVTLGQEMVPTLNMLIDDAHACGVPVIYTQHTYNKWLNSDAWMERFDDTRAVDKEGITHCVENTWGWGFYEVKPTDDDLVIRKARHSAFYGTHLELTLRVLQTKTLVLTGVATGGCVTAAARDALTRDLFAVVVEDCTAHGDAKSQEDAISPLRRTFPVVKARDVSEAWRRVTGK